MACNVDWDSYWAIDMTTIIQSGHFNAYSRLLTVQTRRNVLLSKHKIHQFFSSKCNQSEIYVQDAHFYFTLIAYFEIVVKNVYPAFM